MTASRLNLLAFALVAVDRRRRVRDGRDAGVSHAALTLLMFAGGAAGGTLGFLLLDRHTNKRNAAWHIFALIALLGWALVLVALYVAPLDAGALRAALGRDHTALLFWLAGASAVTFLTFVADKLIAVWNGRGHDVARVPEMALLLLEELDTAAQGITLTQWEPELLFEVKARQLKLLRLRAHRYADKALLNRKMEILLGTLVTIDPVRAAVLCDTQHKE